MNSSDETLASALAVASLISRARLPLASEKEAQAAIEAVLSDENIAFDREYRRGQGGELEQRRAGALVPGLDLRGQELLKEVGVTPLGGRACCAQCTQSAAMRSSLSRWHS